MCRAHAGLRWRICRLPDRLPQRLTKKENIARSQYASNGVRHLTKQLPTTASSVHPVFNAAQVLLDKVASCRSLHHDDRHLLSQRCVGT